MIKRMGWMMGAAWVLPVAAQASSVHLGQYSCEHGQRVTLSMSATQPGAYELNVKGHVYPLQAEASASGAVRLEDRMAGLVWLQLSHKSMLLNQKLGRRMLDDCAVTEQLVARMTPDTTAPLLNGGPPGR